MLFVVKSPRHLIVVLPAALAGAHGLLAVGRPERFPADHTVFLTIVVIAALGLPCRFLLNLGVNMAAVFGAEYLPVACGREFLAAAGADLFRDRLAAVLGQLLRLAFRTIGFFTRTLVRKSFCCKLFLLSLFLGKFFSSIRKVKLPDKVEINIHSLRAAVALALGVIDYNFLNQLPKHLVRDFCRILVLFYQSDKGVWVFWSGAVLDFSL